LGLTPYRPPVVLLLNDTATTAIYTLSLHDALPIFTLSAVVVLGHIALKIFDLIFAMSGPDNAMTSVPAILMYLTTFRGNQFAKGDRKSTRLNSSHVKISYAVFCLKKKKNKYKTTET